MSASLCLEYPLRPDFSVQVVLPRDLTEKEAQRLCEFLKSIPLPSTSKPSEVR